MTLSTTPSTTRAARPRRTRGRTLVAALVGSATVLLAACGSGETSTATPAGAVGPAETLRVGQLGSSKIYEALLKASGEDVGMPYRVEYSLFPGGGPGFIEAARSGSVDLASMADTPPIFGQASGAPIKIVAAKKTVAPDASVVEVLVPANSPARSLQDLKGKEVAVTRATILQYTLIRALDRAGLSYEDVTAVDLAPPDAATAFKGGDVDAIAALDPQRSLLLAAGARKVGDGVGTTAGLGYVVATDQALADAGTRTALEDYLGRLKRAEAWADANTDAWATTYAEVSGLPPAVARSVVEREQVTYVPIDDAVLTAQQEQADTYTELGLLPKKLDVRAQFDTRYNSTVGGAA